MAGQNIAPDATSVSTGGKAYSCPASTPGNGPTFPCSAIDNNPASYWAPVPGSTDPQGVSISLVSGVYSTTNIIADIRVLVKSAGTGGATVYQVVSKDVNNNVVSTCQFNSPGSGFPDSTQLSTQMTCPNPTPLASVNSVSVLLYQGGVEDGSYGLREVQVFKQTFGPSSRQCGSACAATPTATVTSTASAHFGTGSNRQVSGGGQGPGGAPPIATPAPAQLQATTVTPDPAQLPASTVTPTPPVVITGAVDFTIILEVASGAGY